MSTFKEIAGRNIRSYTTNPDNPLEGQMWYNQTELKLKGVDMVTIDEHTHVYYKFQVICEQLQNGKLYSDLKAIAKQAHMVLMKSIQLQFEYRITFIDEIKFEQKIDNICHKETRWCSSLLKNS